MSQPYSILIIGGGAAGFFAAITCAEARPDLKVAILERGREVLGKVRISGGGRCNVTHACFDPRELTTHYPRGQKALLGPFHSFACKDTIEWFKQRDVQTKVEADGRMFPTTDSSSTIVNCLMDAARKANVDIRLGQSVEAIKAPDEKRKNFEVHTRNGETYTAQRLMVATGSNPRIWNLLEQMGHQIVPPVPSLFTFNIKDPRIEDLAGLSVQNAQLKIASTKLQASGPLLITHWGMSGPAILKLSAFGARILAERQYDFELLVNWTGKSVEQTSEQLAKIKKDAARKVVRNVSFPGIPSRLWNKLTEAAGIDPQTRYAELSKKHINRLIEQLSNGRFLVKGKSTFKEEFVTAGGVRLKDVDFKRFESKIHPGLHFAGEVLNIDAITGGFNFQAAWTGGYLSGLAMAEKP